MREKMEPQFKRKWMIYVEDENGDSHALNEDYFIATDVEAEIAANNLADAWEEKTGGLIMKLTIESHGKVK
jgi:hypothetical protein